MVTGVQTCALPIFAGYHLHMIIDRKLPMTIFETKAYIDSGVIKSRAGALMVLLKHGDINQKSLDDGGNLGGCLGKYLSKTEPNPEMKQKHSIYKSNNLAPFAIMRGDDALEFIERFIVEDDLTENYSYSCTGLEYINYLHHYEFNLESESGIANCPNTEEEPSLQLLA